MKRSVLFKIVLSVLAFVLLVAPQVALAGPGGSIAKAIFTSFWGKVIAGVLLLIFLPLIVALVIYFAVVEGKAVKRSQRELARLARKNPAFNWLTLRDRITDTVTRVYDAWEKEQLDQAAEWMSSWYWQNQQLVCLDRWRREGLVNHSKLEKLQALKPLLVAGEFDGNKIDGSRIVVLVEATVIDYLAHRNTGVVVEGKKESQSINKIWTFIHKDGRWVVNNIEDYGVASEYMKIAAELEAAQGQAEGRLGSAKSV